MNPAEPHIGRRLREVRHWRGKSLRVVAGLAGISESYLSRLESGERALDRRSLIVALANALEIAPQELTALPVPAPGNGGTDAAVCAVRYALMAVSTGRPGGQAVPVGVLQDRVAQVREVRRRAGFGEVGAQLPGLIRDVHSSIAAGREVGELLQLAVVIHVHITTMWLRDAGAPLDLRWLAATVAQEAAREHGELTTIGVAAYGAVNTFLSAGAFDLALAELDDTPLPAATPETAGLIGMTAMTRALVAASNGRPEDVTAPMEAAAELADHAGEAADDDRLGFGFGPTNVGLWGMALALESGEPDRAASIAESVNPERHPFKTRQAAYWMDYGRALSQLRGRRDEAIIAFRKAERIFPTRVYRNPFAREAVAELTSRARRDALGRELRGLAYRMGLGVL
jgi:transcriptional regulator with XRE-family HTH domain